MYLIFFNLFHLKNENKEHSKNINIMLSIKIKAISTFVIFLLKLHKSKHLQHS